MSKNAPHKRFPFQVPADEFSRAADEMTAAFLDERGKVVRHAFAIRAWAAASAAAIVGLGAWWLSLPSSGPEDCVTFACLLEQTETHVLEAELEDLLLNDPWGSSLSSDWGEADPIDITF